MCTIVSAWITHLHPDAPSASGQVRAFCGRLVWRDTMAARPVSAPAPSRPCQHCQRVLERPSPASTRPRRTAHRRDDVVREVEHLLGHRSPAGVAAALGYARPAHLARVLYRAGRADLARPFNAGDHAARMTGAVA